MILQEFITDTLARDTIKVAVSGDVMFGRYVGYEYHPLLIEQPFKHVQHIFQNADLSIANLETALYDDRPTWWEKYPLPHDNYQKTIVAPTKKINDIIQGGINLLSLANNHADDAGYEGFESTQSALDKAGILHAGTSIDGDPFEPIKINQYGKDIVFFSVTLKRNFGNGWGNRLEYRSPVAHIDGVEEYDRFLGMVEFQRSMNPDVFIFVAIHWGTQYRNKVEPWQEILAKDIVDSGANCILGHHPHVLQKVSTYKDSLIFFSLGNLLFDHNYDIAGHESKKNKDTSNGAIYTFDIVNQNRIENLEKISTISTPDGVVV